jgi:hypothetical protein
MRLRHFGSQYSTIFEGDESTNWCHRALPRWLAQLPRAVGGVRVRAERRNLRYPHRVAPTAQRWSRSPVYRTNLGRREGAVRQHGSAWMHATETTAIHAATRLRGFVLAEQCAVSAS